MAKFDIRHSSNWIMCCYCFEGTTPKRSIRVWMFRTCFKFANDTVSDMLVYEVESEEVVLLYT